MCLKSWSLTSLRFSYKWALSLFGGSSRGVQLLVYQRCSSAGELVLFHRARSFGRDIHGAISTDQNNTMAGKVVLTYFDGRGKMETIRWLLTVAGVEFDEVYLKKREQYLKLLSDGALMFQQVPLVEIDGMKLVQTKAILNYIAEKYGLQGKDAKERVMINMYAEGLMDLMEMIMMLPFTPPADLQSKLDNIKTKAKERYMPPFEKALASAQYLVGGKISLADVELMECSLMLEEKFPEILAQFPNIKAFQGRMKSLPAINKFLQPGSKRKPQPDENYVKTALEVFDMKLPLFK